MSEERTYESAVARLEEIIRRLDSGQAELRETLELIREGRELVSYCARELEAVTRGPRGAAARGVGGPTRAGCARSGLSGCCRRG